MGPASQESESATGGAP